MKTFDNIYSTSFIIIGGSPTAFLKADGTLDISTYLTSSSTAFTLDQVLSSSNISGNHSILFNTNYGIDTSTTSGSILNIGVTNANTINYGNASTIHNFLGTTVYENQINAYITDKLVTYNYGGAVGSGVGSGFEIQENSVITGYFKTNASRDAFSVKTPAINFSIDLSLSLLTANKVYNLPNNSGTIALISDISGVYYLATNPNNYIALTALSSTITGLTYINTTGVFSLTSGYIIPTTVEETNWNTAYTNRITSLTTAGNSGAATLVSNVLNIPTHTLSGLGGQPLATNLTSLSSLSFVSTSFVKMSSAGTFTLDTNTYLTGNQTITLIGDATGTGTVNITTSISNTTVTGKLLTGYVSGAGTVAATDSILQAIQKLNGNTSLAITSVTGTTNRITSTGGNTPIIDIAATYVGQTSITTLGTITTGVWNGTSITTTFTDAKIKGSIGATSGLIPFGTGTADTITTSSALKFNGTDTISFGSVTSSVLRTFNSVTILGASSTTGLSIFPTSLNKIGFYDQTNGNPLVFNFFCDSTAIYGLGIGGQTPTARLDLSASTTAAASLRIRNSVSPPTTPNNGDLWNDGTDLFYSNGTIINNLSSKVTSISGVSNRITVTGTTTIPIVDISASYIGQTSISTLGTISIGVWNGSLITDPYISSATNWNSKQAGSTNLTTLSSLTFASLSFVKMSSNGTFSLDTSTYLTSNQIISLSGDITGSGSTSINTTLATILSVLTKGTADKTVTITTDVKGRITALTEQSILITESQVVNLTSDLALKANLISPALTGIPTAPTASSNTNTTQLATCAFVQSAVSPAVKLFNYYNFI